MGPKKTWIGFTRGDFVQKESNCSIRGRLSGPEPDSLDKGSSGFRVRRFACLLGCPERLSMGESMDDIFARTRLLLGDEGLARLAASRVAVFGVGGVGGYAVEALARSGVGALDLVDSDTVDPTNLNRQIIATLPAVGRSKVAVAAERVASINQARQERPHRCFFLPETASQFDFAAYDYVIDAVDTVSAKIALVETARAAGVPIVSSMGAGNKLDPTAFRVADIYETSVDPLARVMRRELRRRGVEALTVVYSTEPPRAPLSAPESIKEGSRPAPGSVAFVPAVAGLILGGEVVRNLAGTVGKN